MNSLHLGDTNEGMNRLLCMCRDIADAQAGRSVMSVVCCGHSAKTKIEHMAFQPDGAFLVRPFAPTLLIRGVISFASSCLVECMPPLC